MSLFRDWGFNSTSWQGQRGEYWVLLQGVLLVGFFLLPVYRVSALPTAPALYWLWAVATFLGIAGLGLALKGLLDLGKNLTPLPHPRHDGELVQVGVYQLVRHPIYSGLIFVTIAWALYQWSLSHLIGGFVFLVFFDAKARLEENWLVQKHPDYAEYRQRVKKLIPWIY